MSHQKGKLSEKYAEYFFLKEGFKVFQPELPDSPFDILVTKDLMSFLKIQVKTLRPDHDKDDCYVTDLKRGRYVKTSYTEEEVDYYALFEPINENLYIVPYSEAPKSKIRVFCNGTKYLRFLNKIEL